MRGPGVVFPPTVEVTTHVRGRLLFGMVTVGTVSQPTLDIRGEPLARQLVGDRVVLHLAGAPVLEARGLAAGQEPVEVGSGAGGPRYLAGAECRRHDVAAGAATVASVTSVVPHSQTRI